MPLAIPQLFARTHARGLVMSVQMVSPTGGNEGARDRLSQARTLCQQALTLIDQDEGALHLGAMLQGVVVGIETRLVELDPSA